MSLAAPLSSSTSATRRRRRIRPQPTDRVVRLTVTPPQRQFLRSTAPTVVFQGGARSGKTWAGVCKALFLASQYSDCWGMYVAPSYRQLEQAAMPHFYALAQRLNVQLQQNIQRGYLELPGGGRILLRSAEQPEALLGATIGWAIGDEVALWRKRAYDYLQDRLSDPRGPRQLALTYTPKGRNWAYEILGQPRAGLEIVRATTLDNPYLPADYIERLRREHGEGSRYWQQEVLGEYVAWEGLVYPQFNVERHVGQPTADTPPVRTIVGVDWGWTNPGVMLVVQLLSDERVYVAEEVYQTERPIEWWVEQARQLYERYQPEAYVCDGSAPANIAALRAAGLPAMVANAKVLSGLAAVAGRIANDTLLIHPSCESLIRELQVYSYRQRPDGTVKADEPEKLNDHACDALRYAVMHLVAPNRYAYLLDEITEPVP